MEMLVYAVVAIVVGLLVGMLMAKQQQNRMQSQDIEITTAEQGVPLKVVLGSRDVKASVVWFGDQKSQAIKK